jgi:hypothetical protein
MILAGLDMRQIMTPCLLFVFRTRVQVTALRGEWWRAPQQQSGPYLDSRMAQERRDEKTSDGEEYHTFRFGT